MTPMNSDKLKCGQAVNGKRFVRYSMGRAVFVEPDKYEEWVFKHRAQVRKAKEKADMKLSVDQLEARSAARYGKRILHGKINEAKGKGLNGKSRIQNEILSLHARGKDDIAIALRLRMPISVVQTIIKEGK